MVSKIEKNYLSAKELASMLGLCQASIYRFANEGKLPKPKRIGRTLRWNRNEVNEFLSSGATANG